MTNKQKWHSLAQASRELGHGRNYVSAWLSRHKEEFPEELMLGSGKSKLISDEGIEWVKKHVKKEGVLVSNSSANGDWHLESAVLGFVLLIIHFTGRVRGTSSNSVSLT
ncbi:hypothetical protein [Oenococcus oeni]|uniref:hypothetical protein n=1 Tax=Oenococcus oeni TaxID=1247 RepID=UPI0010B7F4E0|nr:hypothetical protein [Oenococcus oeni]SYW14931.1 conserved hypothetical protein [Oenococcus oeni]